MNKFFLLTLSSLFITNLAAASSVKLDIKSAMQTIKNLNKQLDDICAAHDGDAYPYALSATYELKQKLGDSKFVLSSESAYFLFNNRLVDHFGNIDPKYVAAHAFIKKHGLEG